MAIRSVYFKPLENKSKSPAFSSKSKMLHLLGKFVVEEVKKEIGRLPYDGKPRMKKSVSYKVLPNSVAVESNHPAFTFVELGVKPHVMTYVKNKVIPIAIEDLKNPTRRDIRQGVGFRKVTGHPTHPGMPAEHFVRQAVERAKDRFLAEWQKSNMDTLA